MTVLRTSDSREVPRTASKLTALTRGFGSKLCFDGNRTGLGTGWTRIRKLVTNIRAEAGGLPVAFSRAIPTTQINIRGLRLPHHPSIQSADLTTSYITKVTLKVLHSKTQKSGFLPLENFWPPSHSSEGKLCGCVSRSRNYLTKEDSNDGFILVAVFSSRYCQVLRQSLGHLTANYLRYCATKFILHQDYWRVNKSCS